VRFLRSRIHLFKRQDLCKGFEPDSCFYFRRAAIIRGKEEIDLATDPTPELTIEVDITSSSLNRFPIYAAVGVAEVWRYDGERVRFHALEGTDRPSRRSYRLVDESLVLPPMTAAQATALLELDRREKATVWLRAVRQWIRTLS
jgi:Uma2 family endonuclease